MATDAQNMAEFEAALAAAKTPSELQELMVRFRASRGEPSMYDGRILEVPTVPTGNVWAVPDKKVPKADDGLLRRTFVDNKGVEHEVTGYSPSGLDYLQSEILKRR